MRLCLALAGVGFLVAACTPAATEGGALDPIYEGDLTLAGTEPFWAVEISDTTKSSIFTRPDHAAVTAGPPERTAESGGAKLVAGSPNGDLVMRLKKGDCSDGMSDRAYPMTAELEFNGETFRGCAGKPS